MTDTLPDRLCNDPRSLLHADLLERGIGIRFNGVDRNNSRNTLREGGSVIAGKAEDRRGQPIR